MRVRPALATTYEGDAPELLERIAPLVDFIEVSPDAISRSEGGRVSLRKSILDECAGLPDKVGLIAHGVGLSIGSFDGWNENYLHLIDELFGRFDVAWHSDHLAYTMVAGENIGTMLTLPRTEETVDLICERVGRIQDRFQRPFLLENVIQLLPDAPAEYSPAGYLNAIASRTGC
jgi:uncharacterized protein